MSELRIRLQPRARRNEVVGEREGAVVIRVTAPPMHGKANAALCELIAEKVGVPKSNVTLVHGASSRDKLLRVEGVGEAELRRALGFNR